MPHRHDPEPFQPDAIVVGSGLAGLVTAAELILAKRRVLILEQEPESGLGGQAWWSFGGLFLIDSPEQRRMGVRDSHELARQDWLGSAGFDSDDDSWARDWAEAYLQFAATEKRGWLRARGVRLFPIVGWAERGGLGAAGPGNSVPRFHITWGTGPGLLEPFVRRLWTGVRRGQAQIRFRHRVDELMIEDGAVVGVRGQVLAPDDAPRGTPSNRVELGGFEFRAESVVVASGGIGGDHAAVRANWPKTLGRAPKQMLAGVPAHVDGRMIEISSRAGARVVNRDRMWHYVEGVRNWNPVWPEHGIRILPGPSSLWFDATGARLPAPHYPGFDTRGALEHLRATGHDHSWFVLTQRVIEKEFALSGSEQNPDLTHRRVLRLLRSRFGRSVPGPVRAFMQKGEDFVVADSLDELFAGMRRLEPDVTLDTTAIRRELEAHDRAVVNGFGKDLQLAAVRGFRRYRGDRMVRVAAPHAFLDPRNGPLIAVRLRVLTRKTLGGLQTDLTGRVLDEHGEPIGGLYAAGEASGFGGGGIHGHRALEGSFLGGCLFTGRTVARSIIARASTPAV